MNITFLYVKQKFEEFNQQMFAGKLPMPSIRMSDAKPYYISIDEGHVRFAAEAEHENKD